MRNIKLVLQYEGEGFAGWQSQSQGERTVEGVLGEAIAALTGEPCALHGSGRTDSGVHALAQVASFQSNTHHPAETILRALNAMLPHDIRVIEASDAQSDFHARKSAIAKTYIYLISNAPHISPFLRRYAWHVPVKLNSGAMKSAAGLLVGRHDFRAFMAAGSSVKTTLREVHECSIEASGSVELFHPPQSGMGMRIEGDFLMLTVKGNGFLRHMVRNIAGTLVEAGRGKIEPESVSGILESCDRAFAGPTAPAQGLFLYKVDY